MLGSAGRLLGRCEEIRCSSSSPACTAASIDALFASDPQLPGRALRVPAACLPISAVDDGYSVHEMLVLSSVDVRALPCQYFMLVCMSYMQMEAPLFSFFLRYLVMAL